MNRACHHHKRTYKHESVPDNNGHQLKHITCRVGGVELKIREIWSKMMSKLPHLSQRVFAAELCPHRLLGEVVDGDGGHEQ